MKCNSINAGTYPAIGTKNKTINPAPALPPEKIRAEMYEALDKHTLIIYKKGKITYYNQRNLKPVFLALEDNNYDLSDCYITDRRISKASAILFAYGGAKNIQTPVMTKSAKSFFDRNGIKCETKEITDSVLDKNSKIKCPLEKLVLNTDNPEEGYQILKTKVFPKGMEYEKQLYCYRRLDFILPRNL